MDFKKVFELGKFSDLELILVDKTNSLSINVHKVILYSAIPYFTTMFDNFKEKDCPSIKMEVIDVVVVSDIIKSFYGIETNNDPDWEYLLKEYISLDYLQLSCTLPDNIKVPDECFETLLDLVEIIGYNSKTIDMLANNLPNDFNLSTLPIELLREIESRYYDFYTMIIDRDNRMYSFNMCRKKLLQVTNKKYDDMYYFSVNDNLVLKASDKKIYTCNLSTKILKEHKENISMTDFHHHHLGETDIFIPENEAFKENIKNRIQKYLNNSSSNDGITEIYYSPDLTQIAVIFMLYQEESGEMYWLFIYDCKSDKLKKIYFKFDRISNVLFVPDGVIFYTHCSQKVIAWSNNKFQDVCCSLKHVKQITYDLGDNLLILTHNKFIVYSLNNKCVVNQVNCVLDKIEFVSKEIIIGYHKFYTNKSCVTNTKIIMYNILTGNEINKINVDLEIYKLVVVPDIARTKQKLKEYIESISIKRISS
ncbi:putativeBTB/POZ domain-containing protein [Hirudovirus strain Sangsue]|nr:putativeBTB/POZ domain-containing protein [Hirudovirus strain Sangsue]